jgi:hypothetical protein
MSGIDSTSIPNRVTAHPDVNLPRVAAVAPVREDGTAQQNAAWQGHGQAGGDPSAGRRGHSDPAVSLSASFARIDLGTVLKATVVGFDPSHQPIIKTDQGTFILDAQNINPPLDLKLNSQLELKIVALDHLIEAQIILKDNVRLGAPPVINLTLVGVEESDLQAGQAISPASVSKTGAAGTPGLVSGLPLQYAPQPGQTAQMSGAAKLPPVELPPSVFLSPRGADGGGVAIGPDSVEISAPAVWRAQPPLLTSGDQLVAQEDTAQGVLQGGQVAAKAPVDPEMALLMPPARPVQKDGVSALAGVVWPATVLTVESAPAGQKSGATAAAAPSVAGQQVLPLEKPESPLQKNDAVLVKLVSAQLPGIALAPSTGGMTGTPQMLSSSTGLGVIALSPTSWRTVGEVMASDVQALPANAAAPSAAGRPAGEAVQKTLLVSTPFGLLQVQATADLPVASKLVIELGKMAGAAAAPSPKADLVTGPAALSVAAGDAMTPKGVRPLFAYLDHWPAIDHILQALATANPALAAELQARMAASPGNLGNAALFLAKALGLGNGAEQWLGRDAVAALLRDGRQALIADLNNDLGRIAEAGKQAAPADWKPLLLPVYDGREIHALPLLIRHFDNQGFKDKTSGDGKDGRAAGGATRFVVDVSLSRMGPVQMDGMIRARSFNLIMRTEKPMSSIMRTEIRDIFGKALVRNRFEGDLVFQPGGPFPLSAADYLKNSGFARGSMAAQQAGDSLGNNPGNIYV